MWNCVIRLGWYIRGPVHQHVQCEITNQLLSSPKTWGDRAARFIRLAGEDQPSCSRLCYCYTAIALASETTLGSQSEVMFSALYCCFSCDGFKYMTRSPTISLLIMPFVRRPFFYLSWRRLCLVSLHYAISCLICMPWILFCWVQRSPGKDNFVALRLRASEFYREGLFYIVSVSQICCFTLTGSSIFIFYTIF
jgi:hypothetical protein